MPERLIHETSGAVLAKEIEWARSMRQRVRGLIGRDEPPAALVLEPATQVHTFFMSAGIDVVFCDATWTVLHVCHLEPWRVSRWVRGTRRAIELPAGRANQIQPGDVLQIESYASDL